MKPLIPYSKQWIDNSDIKYITKILRSDWITQGPTIEKFEKTIAKYVGTKYAVAVSSGTAALHAACFAAEIKPSNEVIVPTLTFAASANCVLYLGAKPVLVDIDYETGNIDVNEIRKKITKRTKAIIAVDFAGHPADWDKIKKVAKSHNLVTIDDAAHALGSQYHGQKIGSIADLTIFSFHPVKTITTGEGGMVVTNNKNYYERLLRFRHHGIIKKTKIGGWFYEMVDLGYNLRMTDIQAALGISQLGKIDKFIKKRRAIVKKYNKNFQDLPNIKVPKEKKGSICAWHLYPARFNLQKLGKTKKQIYDFLKSKGLGVQVHYIPIHFHPYYQKHFGYKRSLQPSSFDKLRTTGPKKGDFNNAEKFYEEEISLPLFPSLKKTEIDYVVKTVKNLIRS